MVRLVQKIFPRAKRLDGVFGRAWCSKAAAPNSEGFREQERSGHALPPSPSNGGTGHTLREVRARGRRRLWGGVCPVR